VKLQSFTVLFLALGQRVLTSKQIEKLEGIRFLTVVQFFLDAFLPTVVVCTCIQTEINTSIIKKCNCLEIKIFILNNKMLKSI
jgi:hypothetical protein